MLAAPSADGPTIPTADHGSVLAEGQRLADLAGRQPGSADVLLALVRVGGAATRLLGARGLTPARLAAVVPEARPEPGFTLAGLAQGSHEVALSLGAARATSLHLLLALLRGGASAAETLRRCGHDPGRLRAIVLRALTGPTHTAERVTSRALDPAPGALSVAASESAITPEPEPEPDVPATAADLTPVHALGFAVLHRERELGRVLDLLSATPPRIIAIIGEPGSGRSALLAGLAAGQDPPPLLVTGSAPAGFSPGAFIEDLHRRAAPGCPIAVDGCVLLGAEGGDGPGQLMAAARAGRRFILLATPADVRRLENGAPELSAQMEKVFLPPFGPEALGDVIDGGLAALADANQVEFATTIAKLLLTLSPRYPTDRALPGRALAIAEVAAARGTRLGRRRITDEDVAEVVAAAAGCSPTRLLRTDDERFRTLEERLAERVVGHDAARSRIADTLRRGYAGFRGRRPLASFLLLGPTGVGKTETARAIADALYDGEGALLRIDLSEYSEPHAVARLIGSPPGYVGHEDGGQLTEAIRRRPASVVLLDELEKAHREVLLVLLQVLEDGRLTDGRGRVVDFSAAAVVMTSNLGSECYRRTRSPAASLILGVARSRLPAELWNRIDEVLCYAPLSDSDLRRILDRIAADSSRRLEHERGISFQVDDAVIDHVLAFEPDRSLGARPLRRAFERFVEGPIAHEIVTGNLRPGARLLVGTDGKGRLVLAFDR